MTSETTSRQTHLCTREVLRLAKQTAKAQAVRARYAVGFATRFIRYAGVEFEFQPHTNIVKNLAQNGFAVVKNAVSEDRLGQVLREFETALENGNLGPVARNPSAFGSRPFLDKSEIRLGATHMASHADIAFAKEPLVSCPTSLPLVFSNLIVDVGYAFYGCLPGITDVSVMRTFVNQLPPDGFGLFHCDYQSPRFIKFFFYLHDVGPDDGPFCYVRGSHKRKPWNWRGNNQRDLANIQSIYGADEVCRLTAKAGDLIIADVSGFHCGIKPRAQPRTVLMVNTGVHPIGMPDTKVVKGEFIKGLSPKLAAAGDFLGHV